MTEHSRGGEELAARLSSLLVETPAGAGATAEILKMIGRAGSMLLGLSTLALAACGQTETGQQARGPADVDGARILAADSEPGNWMSHGRTYDEQRFSPLDDVNDGNAADLGLAWYVDLDTARGQEATPIVVDGVMYVTTAWSKVMALDAATGSTLWQYDPEVPGEWAVHACCDVVNRGVAAWRGKVYVGTLDGRLIALDAASGKPVWEVLTVDRSKPYTITGAPRIVKGKVIIGNGGAEMGVRGYVSAYDAETGEMAWRFYTVPGNPADGFENAAMERAAATWSGEWWRLGGGGTVWDSMAYDADLDLLYIGTGNGSPWNQALRSPGGGDNLYLSSIVALKPDTGEYVWHFQETPGETWDFTATQHIVLADLAIDGVKRKTLLHAPKNGFFYVIDRETGKLISAENFVPITWATGVDPATGRPIENPEARYDQTGKPWTGTPGPSGAHSWQPMSFSPKTGLVYIPAQEAGFTYVPPTAFKPSALSFNVGVDMNAGSMPEDRGVQAAILQTVKGHLSAWDPVAQKEVWRAQYSGPSNGGTLATAGNLVFQGTAAGDFIVYRADDGEKLWSMPAQTGVIAAPAAYLAGGEQYVAIAVGWGGVFALAPGPVSLASGKQKNVSRILAFKIGGAAALPPLSDDTLDIDPPASTADAETVAHGKAIYHAKCGACHGDSTVSGGVTPDLRYSEMLKSDAWFDIVLDGALKDNGMVGFSSEIGREDAEAVRAYVIDRANEEKAFLASQGEGQ